MKVTDTTTLGSTSVEVTRLGLGTNALGGIFEAVTEEEAVGTVSDALDAGIRLLDTAPVYGYGNAERAVGKGMAGASRDSFVLTTKVGRILRPTGTAGDLDNSVLFEGQPLYRGTPDVEPHWDFSYDGAMRSLEASLERLGTDRVDAVYVHDPDDQIDAAIEGSCRALIKMREQGVIGAIGVGSNSAHTLAAMVPLVPLDCVLVAGRYSLLDQEATTMLFPLCLESGTSVVVGGVYNSGILCHPEPRQLMTKSMRSASEIPNWRDSATFNYTPAPADMINNAQRLADVCGKFGVPLMAAAIQFPLLHPAVAAVLMGPRSRAEMSENLDMFERDVPVELWDELRSEGLVAAEAGA